MKIEDTQENFQGVCSGGGKAMTEVVICSFFFSTAVALAFLQSKLRPRMVFLARLQKLVRNQSARVNDEDDELSLPFSERVIKPLLAMASQATARFLPAKNRDKLQQMLQFAGNPGNLQAHEFQALQFSLIILLALGGWAFASLMHKGLIIQLLLLMMGGICSALSGKYYLTFRIRTRQEAIQRELPEVLDLLTVSVDAGLGFDSAVSRVVEKSTGVLSDELRKTLKEIQMGKSRRQALKDLGERTGVEDLLTFIGSMIQADQLGVSISKVIRTQAQQIRQKKRQRVEEKAMKAPIKMLIPLVLFIFPTIFIVLLGPALINIMKTFTGM
jgi:tight adherence protein C